MTKLTSREMVIEIKHWLYLFSLLVVLGLIISFRLFTTNDYRLFQHKPNGNSPDFFGSNIVVKKYDKQTGLLVNKFTTSTVSRALESREITLTRPELWHYDDKKKPEWHTIADHGLVFSDQTTFKFYGNVVTDYPATKNFGPIQLKTNELTVHTEKKSSTKDH